MPPNLATSIIPSFARSRAANHIGAFLADHDRRGIGVGIDDGRHDRSVGDAQAGDADDAKALREELG